jgi:hypothetical protein
MDPKVFMHDLRGRLDRLSRSGIIGRVYSDANKQGLYAIRKVEQTIRDMAQNNFAKLKFHFPNQSDTWISSMATNLAKISYYSAYTEAPLTTVPPPPPPKDERTDARPTSSKRKRPELPPRNELVDARSVSRFIPPRTMSTRSTPAPPPLPPRKTRVIETKKRVVYVPEKSAVERLSDVISARMAIIRRAVADSDDDEALF